MKLENRTLILDSQISNEQIEELVSQIVLSINDFDEIKIENLDKGVASSALFALLHTIKQDKEDIKIPFFGKFERILNMGNVLFVK